MPLTDLQRKIFSVIAKNRDPEAYVAGGTPLNRSGPRVSEDIDLFSEGTERSAAAAQADIAALRSAGFEVSTLRQLPGLVAAEVSDGNDKTRLEWVVDSDFRFFPALPDPDFGYVLSAVDLAVNKLMAAIGRREPRDIVDLLALHEEYLRLGAIVWAAVQVAPGFTPEGLLAELRRNSRYETSAFDRVRAASPINAADIFARIGQAIQDAEAFVSRMPTSKCGLLFLEDGRPVQPDPDRLSQYTEHAPARRGHWPTSSETLSAMVERLAIK